MRLIKFIKNYRCLLGPVLMGASPNWVHAAEPTVESEDSGQISVTWKGDSGMVYFLMTTNSLGSYSWQLTHGPLIGNGGSLTRLFDQNADRGFFRVSEAGPDYFTEVDYDKDGIPSAWEVANKLDPIDPASAAHDPDRDGRSALAEYLQGTDPEVKQSDSVSYLYDAKGRLTQVIYPGGKMIEYQYDATGNLTKTSLVE